MAARLTDKQYNTVAIYLVVTGSLSGVINLLGVVTFVRFRHSLFRCPSSVPLLTLLLANLGIVILQSLSAACAFKHRWLWGEWGCQLYAVLMFECSAMQLVSIPFIAFDRFVVTCRPSWSDWRTCKNYRKTAVMLATANAIWSLAPLFGWASFAQIPSGVTCTIDWHRTDTVYVSYLTAVFVFVFLIPFCLASALYNSICQYLKRVTSADAVRRDREEMDYQELSSDNAWAPKNHVGKVSLLCLLTTFVAYLVYGIVCLRPFDRIPNGLEFVPLLMSKTAGIVNPIFHLWLNPSVWPYTKRLFCRSAPTRSHHSHESDTLLSDKMTSPALARANPSYQNT